MSTTTLSEGTLRAIAFLKFNSTDYFILDGIAYEGKEEDAEHEWNEENEDSDDDNQIPFSEFVANNYSVVEEIEEEHENYLVLTDEEATEKAREYIKESLWAFNASFIIKHSKLPYDALEMVQSFQEAKCEDANDTIEALIEDMDEFIEDAIGADGRGHFMNSYDGRENEETVEGETFYIYRIN